MIVLDASAAVELVTGSRLGSRVAERIADSAATLHAPHLLDLEVLQTLRRYDTLGVITGERTDGALAALSQLDLTRYSHEELAGRIWALRSNLTAYDAAYVALAEALAAEILTCDAKLARTATALVGVRSKVVGR